MENPVFVLIVQPEAMPPQLEVIGVPKLKVPTALSMLILFFRRRMTLAPSFRLFLPRSVGKVVEILEG
jgi:hypothetical protein